jgi:hypothetical protein
MDALEYIRCLEANPQLPENVMSRILECCFKGIHRIRATLIFLLHFREG